jgi:flagellar protein FlaG
MPSPIQSPDATSQVVQLQKSTPAKPGAAASADKLAGAKRQELPLPGPSVPADKRRQNSGKTQEAISEAVHDINKFVQSMQRDLHFSVDEDTERVVIKVLDHETGELVRQIPSEEVLRIARHLEDTLEQTQGLIFKEKA